MNDDARTACQRCGHHDVAGTRFCTECGTALTATSAAAAPAGASCPRCGAAVAQGLAFCTECGQRLSAPAAAAPAPPPPPPPACARCGAALAPGLRFCTSCGAPTGAGVAPTGPTAPLGASTPHPGQVPGTSPPGAPPHPESRRVWPWVVAAVVLLAGVVGTGYLLLVRDDEGSSQVARDDRPRADDSADSSAGVSEEPSEGPSEGPSVDASDEPSEGSSGSDVPESSTAPAATATCWDGQVAATVGECSRPQGLAGLRFVFPSMAGQSCSELSGSAAGRKLLIQCFDSLPDGTEIRINYSQWASVSAASAHYASKGLASSQANGLLFFSGPAEVGDDLNTAFIYQKEPYSASVYAPDQASMDEAFTSQVFGVPPAEVRGHAS